MTTEIQKTKRKHKLPLTAVLTYLIVVTLVATGVSLSAYVSTASGGDDANCDIVTMNNNHLYKDRIRTWELKARIQMNEGK